MALTKIGLAALPAGSVIQTKSVSVTAAASITSSSTNTFVDLGLSLAITPSFSSSKILVMVNALVSNNVGTAHFRLVRGSTAISVGAAASDRTQSSASIRDAATPYGHSVEVISINHLDSPSTTSAVTYKVQGTLGSSYNGYFYLNRTPLDTDDTYGVRGASTLTLQEIAV
tara:strand:+ start:31 stop:543 length:513 start_codon:yes stop_codon:yes gene_type:complete